MSSPLPPTIEGPARLAQFLSVMSTLVEEGDLDEGAVLTAAREALAALVAHDDWLDDAFAQPHPDFYQQYLLFCDPRRRFSVVSFVWGPGQRTPIHDHTIWGVVGMLRGAELSEEYELRDGIPIGGREDRLEAGDVMAVSPTVGDIHSVRNAFDDRVSISIHVYGGDIGATDRHIYPPEGGIKHFVSGYSNHYLPNIWGAA